MKKISKILFHPQEQYQEKTLLIIGLIGLILGCLFGNYANVTFDGVLDIHSNENSNLLTVFKENIANIGCVFILLFILGKIINPKTRWIDILITSILYRIPLFLTIPLTKIPVFEKIKDFTKENSNQLSEIPFSMMDNIQLMIASIFILLFLIYGIVLLINGFRTATNIKKWQHFVLFTLVLLIAEIISKILIAQI